MRDQYSSLPEVERFWAKVNKDGPIPPDRPELGPCWLWTGDHTVDGYGIFYRGHGVRIRATHIALGLDGRPVPEGQNGLHHCDNPPCVRDSHLFPGTDGDNLRDAIRKGRHHAPRGPNGERHSQAKLTDDQVREILVLHRMGVTQVVIAEQFPVGRTMISRIVRRKFWSHIDVE